MSKNFVIASTKGGVGKTTLATQVIPCLFQDAKEINIYELDNNNITKLKNSKLNIQTLKINNKANDMVAGVHFDVISQSDAINIIDIGGGNDTVQVLEYIGEIAAHGFTYIVPINDDIFQLYNAQETINTIKEIDPNAPIFLVLNRCIALTEEAIKNQFIGIYGSTEWGIEGKLAEIEAVPGVQIIAIENSNLFTVLSSIYGQTLSDFYFDALELVENIDIYRLEWAKTLSRAEYQNKTKQYTLALHIVKFHKKLNAMLSDLKR